MLEYIAHTKTWLSHENRMAEAGEKFTTTFPEGMKLSGNIELVGGQRKPRRPRESAPEIITGNDDTGADDTGGEETGGDDDGSN
ncbi:hypothetical protein [Methylomonas sp. 11b]|uniref:hypothetical protein n=1 Tax=Methylomonas sp. 11b TaxID=1168169 RepID=UPI00047E52F1|nr:hypothetical protein [Methylomonas sp. 11b]